jgi:hypothetical protein
VKFSRRARILDEVLQYINNGDWDRVGGFLVFGKEAFQLYTGEITDESIGIEESLRELTSTVRVKQGKRAVSKRISLKRVPKDSTRDDFVAWFASLPQDLRAILTEGRTNEKHDSTTNASPNAFEVEPPADDDAIDAALASQALVNLDDALARIGTYDEMSVGPKVALAAEYFEEAHRCDLFGLKIAAALLCRAMLEAALIQVIDPKERIKRSLEKDTPGKKKSYVAAMLEEAAKLHLDPERRRAANVIHLAGNAAAHDYIKFRLDYAPRMREIVDNTRKVIIDLYP